MGLIRPPAWSWMRPETFTARRSRVAPTILEPYSGIDKTGKEKVFYAFKGMPDGFTPGILLPGISGGEFYGVTSGGGAFGYGTVFKLDWSGNEVVLYSFTGGLVGLIPNGLVLGAAGNLDGTTYGGGKSDMGTVFKLTPGGIETVLYSFSGMPDGQYPNGVIGDAAGNLYGTTNYGGPHPHCGIGLRMRHRVQDQPHGRGDGTPQLQGYRRIWASWQIDSRCVGEPIRHNQRRRLQLSTERCSS
jgi:uncharacterized repeat protein (TIGR03803 family)